ncbi:MAG: LLM class flavin-dependent oxidoreductase [Pseudomonadales bacterium]|jgi:alkanesulfonate monooxygenase SsuD/methylene tetrahydromethanopterin reductase-like flavin-dependent oxidoreductase (luciferase family)|nr:LLM class flavin-dependent oxidoreductase [Pseudomonadales bacterium]
MALQLGFHIGQQNLSITELRQLWTRLDQQGADWISLWDHFYEAPPAGGSQDHFEAIALLGALASETRTARLGCLVFYVGYRNPALLAKAAATLDHLSNGRFEIGLGAGWHVQEATAYGYPFPKIGNRLDMLDEAAQIIKGMLSQPRTSFAGKHFSVVDASNNPMPLAKTPALWIGGLGEKKTLRIVAEQATGWNAAYVSPARFGELNLTLNRWCERVGRNPAEIERSVNLSFHLGLTASDLKKERAILHSAWGPQAERISAGALLCTPSEAIERILDYHHHGAELVNVALRAPFQAEALESYLETVMPGVRLETR